jgi:hypothetical protein
MTDKAIIELRNLYESERITIAAFAKQKGYEYWKMRYLLKKGRKLKLGDSSVNKTEKKENRASFKKIDIKEAVDTHKQLTIQTSYGAQIIIPL